MASAESLSAEPASLAEKAYHAVRDMIVSLELRPGAVINERALIEQLGIGRTPIREALRRLAQEQLVEVYPRRGMFVTTIEIRDLASLCEVREVLECHAAELAAQRATKEDEARLRALADEIGGSAGLDQHALMELDGRIHRAVYETARNPFLAATLDEYYVLALRIWHLALDRASELESAVHTQQALLDAIVRGDAPFAARVMRRHVRDFEKSMRRALLSD